MKMKIIIPSHCNYLTLNKKKGKGGDAATIHDKDLRHLCHQYLIEDVTRIEISHTNLLQSFTGSVGDMIKQKGKKDEEPRLGKSLPVSLQFDSFPHVSLEDLHLAATSFLMLPRLFILHY
ncbi:unnamed protein product [Amoebophrya sp. A25]|nr:unnamed protein product [Amoebophrya sp. A25]|eukprot:GSA25T00017325001.1